MLFYVYLFSALGVFRPRCLGPPALCVRTRAVTAAPGLFASSQERTLEQGPREANANVHCSFLN